MTEKHSEQPLFLQERPAGFDRWDMEDRLYPPYQDFTESALILYRHASEIKEKVVEDRYYGEDSPKSYRSMHSIYNLHEERSGKPLNVEIKGEEKSEIIEFLENSLFKRNSGEFGDEHAYEFDPLTFLTLCELHPLGMFDEFLVQDVSDKPTAHQEIPLKKNLLDNPAKVRFAYLTTLAIICSKSNEQSRLESLDTLLKIENHQFKRGYDFHILDVDLGAHKQEFTLQVDEKGAMPGRVLKLSAQSCAELRSMLEELSQEIKSGEFSRLGASLQLSLVMNILPSAIGPERYNSTYQTYLQPIQLAIAQGNVAEANSLFNTLGESLDEEELGSFKVQFEQEARVFTNLLRGIGTPRGLSLAMGIQQALGEFTAVGVYLNKDGKKVSRTTTGNHKHTVVQGFTSFSNPNVLAIWVPNEQVRQNYIKWISSWPEDKREKLLQGRKLNQFVVHSTDDLQLSN